MNLKQTVVPTLKSPEENDVADIQSFVRENKLTPDDVSSGDGKHEYLLRRKPKVAYKSLNSGKSIRFTEHKNGPHQDLNRTLNVLPPKMKI